MSSELSRLSLLSLMTHVSQLSHLFGSRCDARDSCDSCDTCDRVGQQKHRAQVHTPPDVTRLETPPQMQHLRVDIGN
jgi:hypothetical protein